jgi:hypothetical protein
MGANELHPALLHHVVNTPSRRAHRGRQDLRHEPERDFYNIHAAPGARLPISTTMPAF